MPLLHEGLPRPPADRRRLANAACLALAAWITLLPYFTWSHRRAWLATSGVLPLLVLLQPQVRRRLASLPRRELVALALCCGFLVYATALPQVGGGHVAWIYILPFVVALLLSSQAERRGVLRVFELIVCLSLLPGLLWLALLISAVPLTAEIALPPNRAFAAAGVRLLRFPGAVFIESNSTFLPWGGLLSRLCGMFDEPGKAGTLAALLLAASGFEFRRVAPRVLYVAGLCSFSLAFIVLCALGLGFNVGLRRRWRQIWLLLALVPVALLAVGAIRLPPPPAEKRAVAAVNEPPAAPAAGESAAGVSPAEPRPVAPLELRQTAKLVNRSRPEMEQLYERYLASAWPALLLGLGSDASWVYTAPGSGDSISWTSWFTNYGAIGAALLTTIFVGYGIWSLRAAGWPTMPVLFLGLFLLSAYQHPVIWLPYALVLFFGGLAASGPDHPQQSAAQGAVGA